MLILSSAQQSYLRPQRVRINRNSPQARDLFLCVPGAEQGSANIAYGCEMPTTSDVSVGAVPVGGPVLFGNNASGYRKYTTLTGVSEISIAGWINVVSWSQSYERIAIAINVAANASPFTRIAILRQSTNNTLGFTHSVGGYNELTYAITPPFTAHVALCVKNGSQHGYVNGVRVVTGSAGGTWTLDATDALTLLGTSEQDSTSAVNTYGWDFRVYQRFLSDQQVWSLYDPRTRWDLYAVPSRRVYFNVGALGGSTWPGYQSPFGWH